MSAGARSGSRTGEGSKRWWAERLGPSLLPRPWRAFATWVSTVRSSIRSASAISWFVRRDSNDSSNSRLRGVKSSLRAIAIAHPPSLSRSRGETPASPGAGQSCPSQRFKRTSCSTNADSRCAGRRACRYEDSRGHLTIGLHTQYRVPVRGRWVEDAKGVAPSGGGCAKARPSPNKSSRAWGFDRMVFLVGLVADPSPSGASVGDARVAPAFGILAIVDVVVADIAVFGGVVAIAGLGGLLPAPEVKICPVVAGAAWGIAPI